MMRAAIDKKKNGLCWFGCVFCLVFVLFGLHGICLEFFFLAHAVRARGSDGHQNVLWSVNYSQIVREQVKCKKPDVFRLQETKTSPKTQNTNPTQKERRHPRKLSETLRIQNNEILGAQFLFTTTWRFPQVER